MCVACVGLVLVMLGVFECIKYIVILIGFYHKMTCFYNLSIEFR